MQLSHRDSKCCIASLFGTPREFDAWFCLYHPVPWQFWKGTRNAFRWPRSPDHLHSLCATKVPCWLRSNRTVPVLLWVIDATQQFSMFAQLDLYRLPSSRVTATCNEAGFREKWVIWSALGFQLPFCQATTGNSMCQAVSSRSFDQIAVMQEPFWSYFVHYLGKFEMLCYHGVGCLLKRRRWYRYHWN